MFNKIASAFGFLDTVAPPPPPSAPSTEYNWDDPTGPQSPTGVPSTVPQPSGGFTIKKVLTPEEITALKEKEEKERQQREAAISLKKAQIQHQLEVEALSRGQFAKRQKAEYNDRVVSDGAWVPCVVVGVHLDDGPDKPYYTIEFFRNGEKIEKQTMSERVRRIVKEEVEKESEVGEEGEKEKEKEKEEVKETEKEKTDS
jgi:hypothetical protein